MRKNCGKHSFCATPWTGVQCLSAVLCEVLCAARAPIRRHVVMHQMSALLRNPPPQVHSSRLIRTPSSHLACSPASACDAHDCIKHPCSPTTAVCALVLSDRLIVYTQSACRRVQQPSIVIQPKRMPPILQTKKYSLSLLRQFCSCKCAWYTSECGQAGCS